MRYLRCILAFAGSISLLLPGVSARPFPAQCSVPSKYSLILDSVFPVDWDQCHGSSPLSFGTPQITIRILPSFSQESQIFICGVDGEPGQFFVVSSTLDPKEKSVWYPLENGMDLMHAKIWVGDGKQQKPLITLVDNIYRRIGSGNCKEIQRIPKRA